METDGQDLSGLNTQKKLTWQQVLTMRSEFETGNTCKELAKRYGIAYNTVYQIVHNLTRTRESTRGNPRSQVVQSAVIPTDLDKSYAAGLFDGEGSVGIYFVPSGNYGTYGQIVTIAQKGPLVLTWIQERWSGSVFTRKDASQWSSYSGAREFLTDIQPYVIV